MDSTQSIQVKLKWGKSTHELTIQPGMLGSDLKRKVQTLTSVPSPRQKLLCPKLGWKGALKDDDPILDSIHSLQKIKKGAIIITLIGSAEVLEEKAVEDRPRFVEDMSPEEIYNAQKAATGGDEDVSDQPTFDIVAIQKEVGMDRADFSKSEMYHYNRLVTGLPQHQINDLLARKKTNKSPKIVSEVAMTLGMELRRAYINSMAVLRNGTLVSALDDGHVQLWQRAHMLKDARHGGSCVDHVVTFPSSNVDDPAFVTSGGGAICIWTEGGDRLMQFASHPGTTPASIATGTIGDGGNIIYLASCFRVTREVDPNQFRLVPQNEAERQRREIAEAQESLFQNELFRVSQRVKIWFYDSSREGNGAFNEDTIAPSVAVESPPITKLVHLNGKLICGDEWGCIQIFEPTTTAGFNSRVSLHRTSHFQFPGANIACMEPLKDDLLAVSIHAARGETQVVSSSTQLVSTTSSGVYIVDIGRAVVKVVLNGHSDAVECICPLPDGGILTAGGKLDAKVQFWDAGSISEATKDSDETNEVTTLTEANEVKELGYVFDLKVLPDTDPSSGVFAIAAARYNVIKVVL